jgi:23S rRNA pseudouridine2605 synthase
MERSGNRFNKSRSGSGKRSFEKSDSFKPEKKRFSKGGKSSEKDADKPFSKRSDKPYRKKEGGFDKERGDKRSFRDKEKRPFGKSEERGGKKFFKRDGSEKPAFRDKDKSFKKSGDDRRPFKKKSEDGDKPFRKKYTDDDKGSFRKKRDEGDKPFRKRSDDGDKSFRKRSDEGDKPFRKKYADDKGAFRKKRDEGDKPFKKRSDDSDKPFRKKYTDDGKGPRDEFRKEDRPYTKKYKTAGKPSYKKGQDKHAGPHGEKKNDGLTRLNKYLSNAGICSRREADDLIKAGAVSVNGKVITEMGFKVGPDDKVNYGGETLRNQRKIYLLLNKPKDYITTTDDPQERRTVMELVEGACKERIYPVGRLDRNTTGLLLFTNDGELATRLMHPKFGIKKVYHVTLNKNLKTEDFQSLLEGIELEDGPIKPDQLSYIDGSKRELGVEIHSGRNRIVRRMFEHIGYEVIKLDRVVYAGLTKKDLPRAKWRFLNEKELGFLKMIG